MAAGDRHLVIPMRRASHAWWKVLGTTMEGITYTKDEVVGQAVFARNHIDEPMAEGEIDIEVVEPDSRSHLNPRIPTVVVLSVAKLDTPILLEQSLEPCVTSRIVVRDKSSGMEIEIDIIAHLWLKTDLRRDEAYRMRTNGSMFAPLVLLPFFLTTSSKPYLWGEENPASALVDHPLITQRDVVERKDSSICCISALDRIETDPSTQDGQVAAENLLLLRNLLSHHKKAGGQGEYKSENSVMSHLYNSLTRISVKHLFSLQFRCFCP